MEDRVEKAYVSKDAYREFEAEFRTTDKLISNTFGVKDREIKDLKDEYNIFKREQANFNTDHSTFVDRSNK